VQNIHFKNDLNEKALFFLIEIDVKDLEKKKIFFFGELNVNFFLLITKTISFILKEISVKILILKITKSISFY